MAKHIAVVLSQSPRQNPARRNFEETLVAQLLMEDGLEVTIVPHLEHLDEQSTGRLCLEGVTGDMILLASQDPLESDRQLRQLGFRGRFGRTRQTAHASAELLPNDPGPRTLYCVDLTALGDVAAARREVLRIRDDASQSVVLLADFTAGGGVALPLAGASPTSASTSQPAAQVGPTASPPQGSPANEPPAFAPVRNNPDEDDLDRELDGLLDEFDAW